LAKIVVILGSVRSERNGFKVAKWVVGKLKEKGHQVSLVDPVELDLPLLDKMYKEMKSPPEKLQKLQKIIKDAIKLCLYEDPQMSPEGGIAHFGFNIANFNEVIEKCKELGVEVLYGGIVDWDKSKSVYIVDPSGYEIELGEISGGGL
jgi:catechol 2,3-dioxygenase-like lactoylglutathione lyase family enzyme